MQNIPSQKEKLTQIFFPHATQQRQEAIMQNRRFVHYTSAQTAMSIIQNKQIWMKNALGMNDFSEVQHGLKCLYHAYRSPMGLRFQDRLNSIFPGICNEIASIFDNQTEFFKYDTYLTCISAYLGAEDISGRLSMWRAYGRESGVALVLNNRGLLSLSDALKAYTSPVAYRSKEGVEVEMNYITENIIKNSDMLKMQERETIKSHVFNAFRFASVCIKHPGFEEEKEWRIVYSPTMEISRHMEKEIVAVNGIPQLIYKIPLIEIPEEGFFGADIPQLIDHIIIGPSSYQLLIYKTFVELLGYAGVANPEEKVIMSCIPLRC